MRTIKFRGKRVDNDEWVYGYFICYKVKGDLIYYIKNEFDIFKIQEKTVGQFTGLLDKNGVEIYEGQLIESSRFKTKIKDFVNFKNGAFLIGNEPLNNHYVSEILEVIKNIHEQ